MKDITVSCEVLMDKVRANRDRHQDEYIRAEALYRDYVADWLHSRLAEVLGGKEFRLNFSLIAPENHTEDYDRVLAMLEMNDERTITLSEREFSRYVLDKWEWRHQFAATTAAYS